MLVEIEKLFGNWWRGRLIIWVVVWLKVWVLQRLLHCDTLNGVECQELLQKVQSQLGGLGKQGLKGDLLLEGQRADVLSGSARLDTVVVLHRGSTEDVENKGQLVVV